MKIKNIHLKFCDDRASQNQPCFCANWEENNEIQYKYFRDIFDLFSFERHLILRQLESLSEALPDRERHRIITKIVLAFTMSNSVGGLREHHYKLSRTAFDERIPIIFLTAYYPNYAFYGVQFWTENMIKHGHSKNTDGTTAIFCERF